MEDNLLADPELVIKLPFQSRIIMQNKEILEWEFSKSILITAYDILKQENLYSHLRKTGTTFKEYLQMKGFNKRVKIFADTGIFAFEYLKSKYKDMKYIDFPKLEVNDIFAAYDLIDPNFLVAPDEIITFEDDEKTTLRKMQIIEDNLFATVDRFDKKKVYATIQGLELGHIQKVGDAIKQSGVKNAARGGLLPLRRNYTAYNRILQESETVARCSGVERLHAFGLPGIASLHDFFVKNSYDSVDTSTIYYWTTDHKYITSDGQLISVKKAFLKYCDCPYCPSLLRMRKNNPSGNFMVKLFLHNVYMMSKMMDLLRTNPDILLSIPNYFRIRKLVDREKYTYDFGTAGSMNSYLRKLRQTDIFRKRKEAEINIRYKKILVISACSFSKRYKVNSQPNYNRLRTEKQRQYECEAFEDILLPAIDLYTGWDHTSILIAIRELRKRETVDHKIISAGFGLLDANHMIPPYDCTFSGRTDRQIDEMGKELKLKESLSNLGNYRLVYIALSNDYIRACGGINSFKHLGDEVVLFGSSDVQNNLFSYSINEFRLLEQDGCKFDPDLDFTLKIKGNLLQNFAKSKHQSFRDFYISTVLKNKT